ncbi:fatty acyl-AMP ligase [Kitasatospora cineracea]|uniref:Acyl-CoA synthetase (AMP-forming)/AMP-acid ligase II n=1 Tax=Kitasatospora cineracea TaxID=88074 RepID=A0A3N4RPN7_9ACTN|nr:fatty acyl-AMP ligase [Kitasatospora cineracea]RPE33069.1 acyl-CoA synthetase (AMP-forming)/AMP-acid ligase II [Kitasatospora cineracea]
MTTDFFGHRNVGDALAARAAAHPDRTALTIHRGSAGPAPESLTFAELHRRARLRAAALADRFAPGGRVLLALPTSTEFVEVYLGCLLAGLVAVPVPVPGGSAHATARVAAVVRDCTPGLVLATGQDRAALCEWLLTQDLDVPVEAVAPVGDGPANGPHPLPDLPDTGPDTLGVLQYSSGSTGTPKGVMLSHGNILANARAFSTDCGIGPDDRFGNWIPLHHDMGLFTQLSTALLLGATSVLMPPAEFVKRPVEWLRMMDRHRITVTAAPNFAFDLCLRLVTDQHLAELDLSALKFLANGSEPIHAPTLTAFADRFAAAGLARTAVSPGYGLAEATVFVCAKAPGTDPTVRTVDPAAAERGTVRPAEQGRPLVGLGLPGGFESRIVDPDTRRVLPDGAVGELWLRGDSVGSGYWNRPDLTEEVFGARTADGDGRRWLRTGDLGTLLDGELFLTGRLKEMLVLRGRNLFPQDLEQEARAAHPALNGFFGAAFPVPAPDERVVLVHEIDPRVRGNGPAEVAAAVKQRLTAELGAPMRNVVLVRRGSVRRTTSGKVQRTAMREEFLAGALSVVHAELEPAVRMLLPAEAAEAAEAGAEPLLLGGAA